MSRRDARRGRVVIALAIAVVAVATAAAQPSGGRPTAGSKVTVALLPLDAEARLALYGQPVAAEISRALAAEGLDVAVVGQGDPVPSRAVLVVDGKIEKKGSAVSLRLRVRDTARGEVLAEVSATAASLTGIDKAASDVALKLIPQVRELLAARAKQQPPPDLGSGSAGSGSAGSGSGSATRPVDPTPAVAPAILLVATSRVPIDGRPDVTVSAIAPAFERLIGDANHRAVASPVAIGTTRKGLADAVTATGAALGVTVEILALDVEAGRAGRVPVARARARIQIIDGQGKWVFDRIVRTDTLVGKKGELAWHMAGHAGAQLAEVVRTRVLKAARGSTP